MPEQSKIGATNSGLQMMTESKLLAEFWQTFLAESSYRSAMTNSMPEAWSFGDNPKLASDLCQLVLDGTKTATCSLLWEYEVEGESLPKSGELSIILDGEGQPCCVIETTEVAIQSYNQIEAAFAYEEGEGDRSLEYWRQAHWRYFTRVSQETGWTLHEAMPLVCERFRLLWKPTSYNEQEKKRKMKRSIHSGGCNQRFF